MSSGCSEPLETFSFVKEKVTQGDFRREKRLLLQAIAASQGKHRIRLQRELAALEDYERTNRRRNLQYALMS